jgi:hypothetical protein
MRQGWFYQAQKGGSGYYVTPLLIHDTWIWMPLPPAARFSLKEELGMQGLRRAFLGSIFPLPLFSASRMVLLLAAMDH